MLDGKTLLLFGLVVFAGFAVVGTAIGLFSLYKHRTARRCLEQGKKLAREGAIPAAMAQFLKAESAWALNSHDGGRESLLRDLDQYSEIAAGILKVLSAQQGPVHADISGTLAEMRGILRDRSHFVVDGRRMKPEVVVRWTASCERLQSLRVKLREMCEPAMPGRVN